MEHNGQRISIAERLCLSFSKLKEKKLEDCVPTPTTEFAPVPVIASPPLVEVKKENEIEKSVNEIEKSVNEIEKSVFEIRAKLYRYESSTKEWMVKGIGNVKILQNELDPTKVRIVMWREELQTIACNHWITPGMTMSYHMGSTKTLAWSAMDFSREVSTLEIFACRFANEKKCEEFKNRIHQIMDLVKNIENSSDASRTVVENIGTKNTDMKMKQTLISDFFKGSECS